MWWWIFSQTAHRSRYFLSYATLSEETAYGRIHIFEWGMNNVWKHPFIGIGMNEWERPWWKSASMDNFWLLATVRYGIPGFLLLAVAYLLPVWAAMRRDFYAGGPIWQFRRAWVFMQVGMILTLCTVDVWATALSFVFFLLGAGVWLVSFQPDPIVERELVDQGKDPARRSGIPYTRFPGRGARQGSRLGPDKMTLALLAIALILPLIWFLVPLALEAIASPPSSPSLCKSPGHHPDL